MSKSKHKQLNEQFEDDGVLNFVLDSGATVMVNQKSYFNDSERISPVSITIAKDSESLIAKERGNIKVKTFEDGDNSSLTIPEVLIVKDLNHNLMSVGRLCDKGYEVTFKKCEAIITKNGKVPFTESRNGNVYEVDFKIDSLESLENRTNYHKTCGTVDCVI